MNQPQPKQSETASLVGKILGGVFGLIFAGIGVTVIVFLWSAPFGDFHSPPLFFRVFGTFIALAFVAMGCGVCFTAITVGTVAGRLFGRAADLAGPAAESGESAATASCARACPHCGAPPADGADVSPHGDTKCRYCGSWFNIHGK